MIADGKHTLAWAEREGSRLRTGLATAALLFGVVFVCTAALAGWWLT